MSTPAKHSPTGMEVPPLQDQADKSLWQSWMGTVVLAGIFAALIFIISSGADLLMLRNHEPARFTIEISDAIASGVIGLLTFHLLRMQQQRREILRKRVEIISEMNHHVRNGLQVISYTAHGSDQREIEAIQESVNRIQWALRELL